MTSLNNNAARSFIGEILREWRTQRRFSQLNLAVEIGVSSKHISFIETGKSLPSREMILKIGNFLSMPRRAINHALTSAGYAPGFTDLPLSHEALAPVVSAIDQMIESHMPYPAIVIDSQWDVFKANGSAEKLLRMLGFSSRVNIIELLASGDEVASIIRNWQEVAEGVRMRLRQELSAFGGENQRLRELETLLDTCLSCSEQKQGYREAPVVTPVIFEFEGNELSLFSVVAQLSNVQDVTVSEYRVELMFPADEQTREFYSQQGMSY